MPLQIVFQDHRIFEMMTLAQDMGIEELKTACEDHVISTLSVANACSFLQAVMEIPAGELQVYYSVDGAIALIK